MKRLLAFSGLPTLEQLSFAVFTQFERFISMGGAVPAAVGTLLAYLFLLGLQRPARV